MNWEICGKCVFCKSFDVVHHRVANDLILHGRNECMDTICMHRLKDTMDDGFLSRSVNRKWVMRNLDNLTFMESKSRDTCPHYIELLMI